MTDTAPESDIPPTPADLAGPHRVHVRATNPVAGLAVGEEGWVDSDAADPLIAAGDLEPLDA